MERISETIGDRFGLDKASEQERYAREATSRMAGDAAASDITSQNRVIRENTAVPIATNDAQLSWAGGPPFASPGGPGDIPLSADAARAAAVGPIEGSTVSPIPNRFGVNLTSSPLAVESRSGRHQNTAEILGGK